MAVTAIKIEDRVALLREARAKLYGAIFANNKEKVKMYIDEVLSLGGDLNQPWKKPADKYNSPNSPIALSAMMHNLEAMRLLFNKGIDPNSECDETPLMNHACSTGNEEVASLVIRTGGRINVQCSCDTQPIHAAMFDSIVENYSVIFNSDWGSQTLKSNLIAWWKGGEFTPPSTPLRARWPGSIPLVALLLKHGADPTVETSSGLSPLKLVRDPGRATKSLSCFELDDRVKFIAIKDNILTFQVNLKDRQTRRRLENVIVDFDVNMELPKDVVLSAAATEVLSTKKTRTMRGLIEAYAPKDKSSLRDDGKLDAEVKALKEQVKEVKVRSEKVEVAVREVSERGSTVAEVKVLSEKVTLLQDQHLELHQQHVVVYQEHLDRKKYRERLEAVKKDKGSPVYAFFDTVSKELDRLFSTYKLLMKDPEKFDKTEAASKVIGALANFAPAPFNAPAHAIVVLVNVYGQYRLRQEQSRVIDLLERDHGPMCDDLALRLSEHYGKQLADMEPEKAKKLAQNAVGVMFALMCDSEKTLNPLDSSRAIQDQLFEAVKTSDFFSKKLKEHLAPPKSRFMLPSFGSKPTLPPAPPRSASQPPGPRTVKKPEDPPKTSKSSSILSAFTRSKSPEPQAVVSESSGERCKPFAPSPVRNPTSVVQSVK